MNPGRARELFGRAVRTLALQPTVIQERMGLAWRHLSELEPADLPEAYRPELEAMQRRMAAADAAPDGTVMAAARRLTDDEAIDFARWILETEYQLRAD